MIINAGTAVYIDDLKKGVIMDQRIGISAVEVHINPVAVSKHALLI